MKELENVRKGTTTSVLSCLNPSPLKKGEISTPYCSNQAIRSSPFIMKGLIDTKSYGSSEDAEIQEEIREETDLINDVEDSRRDYHKAPKRSMSETLIDTKSYG
eukprot:CAMPEP_0170509808 /NCGR_PEP_ID=MMETSP0208-20121228/65417_1 /TAXON_ID=197538 /ORGANISM="Strombidium inclinatum, Strain S3" /LENGTH=103 /DNA_ID=CAMNT_0010793205 /DNA_START=3687 /DNA_END=3995 /DNA_ORIENTATION=-